MSGFLPSTLFANVVHSMRPEVAQESDVAVCTYAVEFTGAIGFQAAAEGIGDIWATNIVSGMSLGSQTIVTTTTLYIGPTPSTEAYEAVDQTTTGVSTDVDIDAVAVLVRKRTGLIGRRNRGRFYLPWTALNVEVTRNGTLASIRQTSVQSDVDTLLTALDTHTTPMVLAHSSPTFGSPLTVTSLDVASEVGIQRRRMGRYD